MRVILKTFLLTVCFCLLSSTVYAEQVMVIVSPVNVHTKGSAVGIYPNISDFISTDIINELNKDPRFDVPDINSADTIIMSQGLFSDYTNFLKNYKHSGIIDYKMCGLLNEKLGFDKILLVSSGFSMQEMILKRPLLYKLGFMEGEPIRSFYKLNVKVTLIDAQSCIVDFAKSYNTDIRSENFEVPTSSFSDNISSTGKIEKFSEELKNDIYLKMIGKTNPSRITRVKSNIISTFNNAINAEEETTNPSRVTRMKSNIISTFNKKIKPKEGITTRDGHSYSTNNEYLENKRKESFKNWIREKVF